tara:strand:+ start:6238 stop:6366 length:129 start_codon:yes stop_codon:yes gene_type:complete
MLSPVCSELFFKSIRNHLPDALFEIKKKPDQIKIQSGLLRSN